MPPLRRPGRLSFVAWGATKNLWSWSEASLCPCVGCPGFGFDRFWACGPMYSYVILIIDIVITIIIVLIHALIDFNF